MRSEIEILCKRYTSLTDDDIGMIVSYDRKIQTISALTGNDIFIDALTSNGEDSIVLAWARPKNRSLYNKSVVGELAYSNNEPGVYRTIKTGTPSRNIRGVSQEGTPIAQTVEPIMNEDKIIGVLIMEKDITEEIQKETEVGYLKETVIFLKKSLMELNLSESYFADWFNNGVFVLNTSCKIIYSNKSARDLYIKNSHCEPIGNDLSRFLGSFDSVGEMLKNSSNPTEISKGDDSYYFHFHPLGTEDDLEGAVIVVHDMTEIRIKEKEIQGKDILIREIHHRVKNNLQNIAAILQLQMRRTNSEEVKNALQISINRIISIATAHNVFSKQNIDRIDLKEFISYILNNTIENYKLSGQQITSIIEGHNVEITNEVAVPIALIANEIISNSLKHGIGGEDGEVRVNINAVHELVIISFYDSGKSSIEVDMNDSERLGLQIVKALAEQQLGGSFRIGKEDETTKAEVIFALKR
jgi:two-component system, sensor histidine kinase PdtaS